tara:strand:- start:108 stop:587 length:480 start_codon:yes stop_codon:yes gene_type:complete
MATKTHKNFLDRLENSKPAVFKVGSFIKSKGYKIDIPKTECAPNASEHEKYADKGDLTYYGKYTNSKNRIEVKHLGVQFTNSNDWVYGKHFFVCAKHSYDNAVPKPSCYFILNKSLTHFAIVKCETVKHWTTQMKQDKERNSPETFYKCPLNMIYFGKF